MAAISIGIDYDLVGHCTKCHKKIANFTERGTFDGFTEDAKDIYFVLSNQSKMHSKLCSDCLKHLSEADYPIIMASVTKGWYEELARNGVTKPESDRYMATYKEVSILAVYDDTLIMGGAVISLPNTFTSGTTIQSAQVNSNFTTIYNDYNGNITNANLAAGAAIVDTKLASISTAGKVSGAALTSLSSIPSGAGLIPSANLTYPSPNTTTTNYFTEGYSTGRNVLRMIALQFGAGGTPGTNINVSTDSGQVFNAPSYTQATNLAASGTSGSFSLSSDGKTVTFDITENIIAVLATPVYQQKVKNGSAAAGDVFMCYPGISSNNATFTIMQQGNLNALDWRLVLTTSGDRFSVQILFLTST